MKKILSNITDIVLFCVNFMMHENALFSLNHGSSNLACEIDFAAEFSSNRDEIHLPVISNDPEDID